MTGGLFPCQLLCLCCDAPAVQVCWDVSTGQPQGTASGGTHHHAPVCDLLTQKDGETGVVCEYPLSPCCDQARWLANNMYLASCRPGQTAALELQSHLAGWCCFLAGDAGWEGPVLPDKALPAAFAHGALLLEGSEPRFRVWHSTLLLSEMDVFGSRFV